MNCRSQTFFRCGIFWRTLDLQYTTVGNNIAPNVIVFGATLGPSHTVSAAAAVLFGVPGRGVPAAGGGTDNPLSASAFKEVNFVRS